MRPRILNGQLPLGQHHPDPIRDGEAFITNLITTTLDDWGMYITDDEHQDLTLDLLTEALRLEKTFDAERNTSYAGYASWILRKRVVDLCPRKLLGRNGQRAAERTHDQLDESLPGNGSGSQTGIWSYATDLDALVEAYDRRQQNQPQHTLTQRPGNTRTDRTTDERRLERERTRRQTRAATVLGLRAA